MGNGGGFFGLSGLRLRLRRRIPRAQRMDRLARQPHLPAHAQHIAGISKAAEIITHPGRRPAGRGRGSACGEGFGKLGVFEVGHLTE